MTWWESYCGALEFMQSVQQCTGPGDPPLLGLTAPARQGLEWLDDANVVLRFEDEFAASDALLRYRRVRRLGRSAPQRYVWQLRLESARIWKVDALS